MRGESAVCRQLLGDLASEVSVDTARLVDPGELAKLTDRIGRELARLASEVGALGVRL